MLDLEVEAIKARLVTLPQGPLITEMRGDGAWCVRQMYPSAVGAIEIHVAVCGRHAHADLIAQALTTDIAALIAELTAARVVVEEARDALASVDGIPNEHLSALFDRGGDLEQALRAYDAVAKKDEV